jgi:hypothetical protein
MKNDLFQVGSLVQRNLGDDTYLLLESCRLLQSAYTFVAVEVPPVSQ